MNRRRFNRKSELRDSSLIILTCEGEKTEPAYFNGLKTHPDYKSPKIHIEIISRNNSKSAPEYVIKELDKFKLKYNIEYNDELWMIIDCDRWGSKKIKEIAKLCNQKGYKLCVSNPRFEIWLLLHFIRIKSLKQTEINAWLKNNNIEKYLKENKYYNKKKEIEFSKYFNKINIAIDNAKELDVDPNHRWPKKIGTRVYLILESIKRIIYGL